MEKTYRILNYAIAAEVVIQAAAIAWAVFGLNKYIDDGNTLTKAKKDSSDTLFTGTYGYAIHGINGALLIPLIGLALLIVAFFAKVPGGVKWAGILFGLIIVQAFVLPALASAAPIVGALHGANALAILALSIIAARRVSHPAPGSGIPATA